MIEQIIRETVRNEVAKMFSCEKKEKSNYIAETFIDKYVIIRTYSAGVHFGKLVYYDSETKDVVLTNARRIHYWDKHFTLSQIAKEIGDTSNWRVSTAVEAIKLTEIEIITLSKQSTDELHKVKDHEI